MNAKSMKSCIYTKFLFLCTTKVQIFYDKKILVHKYVQKYLTILLSKNMPSIEVFNVYFLQIHKARTKIQLTEFL